MNRIALKLGAVLLFAASGLFGSGCAATLAVQTLRPGPVSLGPTRRLSVVAGEGRRSARETVYHELIAQAQRGAYYQVVDRSEEGIGIRLAGRKAEISGDKVGMQPNEMYMRIDVPNWEANTDTKEETIKDKQGNVSTVLKRTTTGRVILAASIIASDGRALLAEKEYVGEFSTTSDIDRESAILSAGKVAVHRLLIDITPIAVVRRVRIDDDDKAQKPFIRMAQDGNVPAATEELRKYLAQNPQNTAAVYNLAVLTDALGRYDEALNLYDQAMAGVQKDFYAEARAGCAQRKADADALR